MKLIIVLGLLLCALPAKADSIIAFTSSASFTGPNTESFATSFDWDIDLQAVILGSLTTTTSGNFGTFAFSESLANFSPESDAHTFMWNNTTGDTITLWDVDLLGSQPHSVVGLVLNDPAMGNLVANDWTGGPLYHFGTPTPEPSSLLMFGIGLLAITLISSKQLRRLYSD